MLAKAVLAEPWTASSLTGVRKSAVACGSARHRGIGPRSARHLQRLRRHRHQVRRGQRPPERLHRLHRVGRSTGAIRRADLQVDVVLASDLTYEARHVEPLVALVERVLKPGGLVLVDRSRPPAGRGVEGGARPSRLARRDEGRPGRRARRPAIQGDALSHPAAIVSRLRLCTHR